MQVELLYTYLELEERGVAHDHRPGASHAAGLPCLRGDSDWGVRAQVGGFYLANIPAWIAWLKYLSFIYFGYNLLLKAEYHGRTLWDCGGQNPPHAWAQRSCKAVPPGGLPQKLHLQVCSRSPSSCRVEPGAVPRCVARIKSAELCVAMLYLPTLHLPSLHEVQTFGTNADFRKTESRGFECLKVFC